MASEFEILNAKINIDVNAPDAVKDLSNVNKALDKFMSSNEATVKSIQTLVKESFNGARGFQDLEVSLRNGDRTIKVIADSAKEFSLSIADGTKKAAELAKNIQLKGLQKDLNLQVKLEDSQIKSQLKELQLQLNDAVKSENAANSLNELQNRFNVVADSAVNFNRSIKQVGQDVVNSFALINSGGSKLTAFRQIFFGLGESSSVFAKGFDTLTNTVERFTNKQSTLQKAVYNTAKQMSDAAISSQTLVNRLKDIAKVETEGLLGKDTFTIFTAQIQNVTNEYQRLERVILSGGKPTRAEIDRLKVEFRATEQAIKNLRNDGVIPVGSTTETVFNELVSKANASKQAIALLEAQMQALNKEEEKVAQKAKALAILEDTPKRGYFSWLSLFNIFKKAPSDINSVNSSLSKANSTIERTSGLADGLKFTIAGLTGGIIGGGLVSAIPAVFSLLQDKFTGAIQAASDAAEEASKFETVFDSKVDPTMGATDTLVASVRDTLDQMAQEMDRSRYELRKFAAAFQDTFVPLGFGREEAAKLSINVTKLTEDLSSFYNMSEQQVSDRLSSFLVGNYENARAFGSIVTDARLDAELLKMGIAGGTEAVDQQTKSLVALKLLYSDTSDAQGDVIRTANSFANQLRVLQGQARDAAVELGTKLLVVLNPLLTAFIRLKSEIGPSISAAFNSMFNAISPLADAFNTIIAGGSIEDIFNSIVGVAQNGVIGIIETLDSLIPYAADWAYGWGQELYNGLLDVVDLVWDAVNQIAEAMADMLMPGSPPKEGPLSTIDTWGKGLMDTFSSGLDAGSTVDKLNQELNQVTANLLKTRQEIIDAEKAGYVPPELKERLALEEQQQQNLKDQIANQSKLDKQQTKQNQQQNKKSSGGGGNNSPERQRKETEKKTAQEIYAENLRILDQQLKDGVIKYEDYAKERLKIEKDFNEGTLKEGLSATSENIANIKKYQAEVDSLTTKAGGKKDKTKFGLKDLGLTVDDFLPNPVEIKKNVKEAVSQIATTVTDTFQEKITQSSNKLSNTISTTFTLGFTDANNNIKESLNIDILGSINSFIDGFKSTFNSTEFISNFIDGFKNLYNIVVNVGNGIYNIYVNNIKPFVDNLLNAGSSIKIDFGEIGAFFGNILNDLGRGFLYVTQIIKDFSSSFSGSQIITNISNAVLNLTKSFTDFFSEGRLGGEIIRLITTLFNQLYQIIINNKEGWQLLAVVVGVVIGLIADVLISTLQALVDILPYIEGALTGVVQIFTGLINIIGGVVGAFQAAFALFIDVITGQDTEGAKQKLYDSFGSIATGLTDVFKGAYTVILNLTEGILIGLSSFFSNFLNNIGSLIGGGFGTFTQGLVNTKDQLIFIFSNLNTEVFSILNGLADNGKIILTSLFNFLITEPKKAVDTVIQLFTGLYNELIGHSIIPDMISGIINAITIFKTDFLGIISSLITGTLDFFLGIGKSIITSIITSIQENAGALLNVFSTLFGGSTAPDTSGTVDTSQAQQIIASAQQVFITLTNFTGTLQTSFNNFISSSLAYLSEVANNTLNTFILVRDTLIGENSLIEELATTIVSILAEMGVSINTTLSYIQDSAVQVFKIEKWSAIGRFIVSGIQTGMSEKRDSFLSYVRKLAKQAVDTAANELGIKSPSIKFRELGINSVEGFKQGLEALPPTTNNIAEQAMDGISSVFKSFNEINRKVLKNATVDIFKANQTELLALIQKGGKAAQIRLAELYGDNDAIVKSGLNTMDLAGKFIKSFVSSKEIMNQEFINTGTNFVQGILGQQQDIVTAFNTTLENVRYQTNSTRNAIEDAFKQPLTDEFLKSLYTSVKNGETFGVQLDSQIKIAYLSQEKLNASLVDQLKIEEQIRDIQSTQLNIDKITKPINDIAETVDKEAGALDLLDSLKLGIDATAPDVLKKLSQLANDMVTKLNSTLKINSPSKVFMTIGENLGLGLVAGLDSANKLIPTTIQDISNNLTSALKNSTINQNGLALNANVNGGQLATQPVNVTIQNNIGNNMDLAVVEQRILNTVTKAIRR